MSVVLSCAPVVFENPRNGQQPPGSPQEGTSPRILLRSQVHSAYGIAYGSKAPRNIERERKNRSQYSGGTDLLSLLAPGVECATPGPRHPLNLPGFPRNVRKFSHRVCTSLATTHRHVRTIFSSVGHGGCMRGSSHIMGLGAIFFT